MLLLERYSAIRYTLVQINASSGLLNENQQAKLQEAVVQIVIVSEKIERSVSSNQSPKNVAALNRIISEQMDSLGIILTELKNVDWNRNV